MSDIEIKRYGQAVVLEDGEERPMPEALKQAYEAAMLRSCQPLTRWQRFRFSIRDAWLVLICQ